MVTSKETVSVSGCYIVCNISDYFFNHILSSMIRKKNMLFLQSQFIKTVKLLFFLSSKCSALEVKLSDYSTNMPFSREKQAEECSRLWARSEKGINIRETDRINVCVMCVCYKEQGRLNHCEWEVWFVIEQWSLKSFTDHQWYTKHSLSTIQVHWQT